MASAVARAVPRRNDAGAERADAAARGHHADLVAGFCWAIPQRYIIGADDCDRHAPGDPLALIDLDGADATQHFGFDDLRPASNRFANRLATQSLRRGDRLGALLPPSPETAIAHLASSRAGLITVPLFTLFGPGRAPPSARRRRRASGGDGPCRGREAGFPARPAAGPGAGLDRGRTGSGPGGEAERQAGRGCLTTRERRRDRVCDRLVEVPLQRVAQNRLQVRPCSSVVSCTRQANRPRWCPGMSKRTSHSSRPRVRRRSASRRRRSLSMSAD
ncbi:AMP-binding protein [Methylobacterium sp. 4-46]|uniref:AMP-binding protein n=1 Tax=unclassified Methylobacterium TaxID=2615210 RepID=UPI000152D203